MPVSRWLPVSAGILLTSVGACGGGHQADPPPPSTPAASASGPAGGPAARPCPLTVEQVAAATGVPMTQTGDTCTFFPANGRDIPHVFYVLQNPMVCNSITPSEAGFTEPVTGLEAREAYVRDQLDGAHVLVCPNGTSRAFDIVVDITNDRGKNREAAVALAKQVLAAR